MAMRMLASERESRILELLSGTQGRSIHDLSAALDVSMATVRRDLAEMEHRRLLTRVRGGATLVPARRIEPLFAAKETENREAKERIARAALGLVEDHDVIYLDGGSTVLMLARLLVQCRDLTVVTNSLMAAAQLMESGHHLILCGGEFRALSRTLVGPLSKPILESIAVDKAFMGTIGFTLSDGMSTTDANEAFTKEQVMRRAKQVILLADHSKFGTRSLIRCGLDRPLDVLITDAIDDKLRQALADLGTDVIVSDSSC